jgi:hypothetical protein
MRLLRCYNIISRKNNRRYKAAFFYIVKKKQIGEKYDLT